MDTSEDSFFSEFYFGAFSASSHNVGLSQLSCPNKLDYFVCVWFVCVCVEVWEMGVFFKVVDL